MARKKNLKYNPFLIAFICFALIVCLILSVLYLSMIHAREQNAKRHFYQDKAQTMLNDFTRQLQNLDDLALRFVINDKYMYSTVFSQKYNEYELLNDFKRYKDFSFLTENMFLYYTGEDRVFRADGDSVFSSIFFGGLSPEAWQQMKEALDNPGNSDHFFSMDDKVYILIPFRADHGMNAPKATLGCVLTYSSLEKRLELVSGRIEGDVALYDDETLLFCNNAAAFNEKSKGTIMVAAGNFHLYYIPKPDTLYSLANFMQGGLVLAAILAIVVLACLFANRVYRPLHAISEKYADSIPDNTNYHNVYEEIEGIVDGALQTNLTTAVQVEQKQELFKQHILKTLLNGTYIKDVELYLAKLNILLPGPLYYVVSIAFSQDLDSMLTELLQKELKEVASMREREYLYPVSDAGSSQLWIICSIEEWGCEEDLTERIEDIITSYDCAATIGVGKVYEGLKKVPASWLESVDNLTKGAVQTKSELPVYHYNDQQWLSDALSTRNKEIALRELDKYVQWIRENNQSLLMQLYLFTEFIGEIARLSRLDGITLSNQKISLVLAARNLDSFYEAARDVIIEYCEKQGEQIHAKAIDSNQRICGYIKAHFMEYDISVDKIATDTGVQNVDVRAAVRSVTGKKYTDYVTALRMDYAKQLMTEQQLSVADICKAVGYSSVSYFIRIFKEETGTTPAKYMKEIH